MAKFELVEIVTKDKLVHQGMFARPEKADKRAILWVHGLTGRFYGDVKLMNVLAEACGKNGMAFASFNTRGHDMVTSIRKVDSRKESGYSHETIGAAYEKFEDSVHDIDAGISFLENAGFTEIIIAGHSTGANKVCFYAAIVKDPRVVGVVLAGPMSDRHSARTDKVNYEKNLREAHARIAAGKGDTLEEGKHFFPITPKRFVSLLAPNTQEDVFTYGDSTNALSTFSRIQAPLLVVFSQNDEVADRPVRDIQKVFDAKARSLNYRSIMLPDTDHGYTGKEREFVATVVDWAAELSMDYHVVSMFIPNKEGLKLDTEIYRPETSGRLPVVILLHGFTGFKEDPALVDIARRLAESGIVSVRFTSSGFGGSEGTLVNDYRFSNYRKDADAVYEYISKLSYVDASRLGVYGHSMGGKLAILFTRDHERVKAVCVMSAPVTFENTAYGPLLTDWKQKGYLEKVSGRDGKTIRVPYDYVSDVEQPEFNVLSAAAKITSPRALIIGGTADTEVQWQETKKIYDALPCPKEWLLLDGVPHKYGKNPSLLPVVSEPIATFFRGMI